MDAKLEGSIGKMTGKIVSVLEENGVSVYLYGSVVLGDFRPGWSDIDLLVLTKEPIAAEQAERLVGLKQEMSGCEPENPYYRAFEGGMLPLRALVSGEPGRVVYWGTSGQRIKDRYDFDSFSRLCLKRYGMLLYGEDERGAIPEPADNELWDAVSFHLDGIRSSAHLTGRSLYSLGWMLDISRCFYTLRTGDIISKTGAGEWALENGVCPEPAVLERVLEIRKSPMGFDEDKDALAFAGNILSSVRRYADELEKELNK